MDCPASWWPTTTPPTPKIRRWPTLMETAPRLTGRSLDTRLFEMHLLTPTQYAKRHGVSARRIQALLAQGRIPGAQRIGSQWAIPEDAPDRKSTRLNSSHQKIS